MPVCLHLGDYEGWCQEVQHTDAKYLLLSSLTTPFDEGNYLCQMGNISFTTIPSKFRPRNHGVEVKKVAGSAPCPLFALIGNKILS